MPLPARAPRLGDLERTVMEHLWQSLETHPDGATVRDVLACFAGERQIAYTTVMTVLDRLAKKSFVTRERVGRAWVYRPAHTRSALTAATLRSILDVLDAGQRRLALADLLETATAGELDDLRADLDAVLARRAREDSDGGERSEDTEGRTGHA